MKRASLKKQPEDQRNCKAAIYVRMSTDLQQYSIENQTAAMEKYAAEHDLEIVRTYTDGGKSGLSFQGRRGLQALIADVQRGIQDYGVILVLDVTRWGRYQDSDESAYYEVICRRAGYSVQYVAEQFRNDGSLQSNLMKNIKRSMAGEYSRELSGKVFAGQRRLIEKGFKQGGSAGYGLRRMMVDEKGNHIMELARGQYKSLQTYRVILVPGPAEEIENVRWVYKAFVDERLSEVDIAARLNARGVLTDLGRAWTRSTVHQILTNEKYIGNSIYNRRSYKLKEKHVENPPGQWVRFNSAFEAIIESRYFYAAQGIIQLRSRKVSNDELLEKLKDLKDRRGWLSGVLINECEDMPSSSVYSSRFGGLTEAYKLIGYEPERDIRYIEDNRYLRSLYPEVVESIVQKIESFGGRVRSDEKQDILIVNDEIRVSVTICRCAQTPQGKNRWRVSFDAGLMPDITLAVRMDQTNKTVLDYYVIPSLDVENPELRLTENNHFALDAYRFKDLEPFFVLTKRSPLQEVA